MIKTAKLIRVMEARNRPVYIYKVTPKVKYRHLDGTQSETSYLYLSRIEERWGKETMGFACDFDGKLLDFDLNPVFSYSGISEQEALKLEKYKMVK